MKVRVNAKTKTKYEIKSKRFNRSGVPRPKYGHIWGTFRQLGGNLLNPHSRLSSCFILFIRTVLFVPSPTYCLLSHSILFLRSRHGQSIMITYNPSVNCKLTSASSTLAARGRPSETRKIEVERTMVEIVFSGGYICGCCPGC